MREKRTDLRVAKVKPPPSGRLDLWDAMLPGFGLRVTDKGKKSWVVMYRLGGRTAPKRRLTLRQYPKVSLQKAREEASRTLALVAKGEDPAAAKAERQESANTFEIVAAEFIERYAKPKNRGWKRQEAEIARELLPYWKGKPISAIKRNDVLHVLDRVSDRTSPLRANRILALIRKFFSWCLERGLLEVSPAATIKPPGKEQSRDRVLSDEEIRDVWTACEKLGYANASANHPATLI